MRFTKMHGAGNDYVYVNAFQEKISDPVTLAKAVSDRHTGIGSDGLILIGPSAKADARMRIFNADGSEAEMCGNGLRCTAKYLYEHGLAESGGPFALPGEPSQYNASVAVETGRGVLTVGLDVGAGGKVRRVCVNMGQPILEPPRIPVLLEGERVVNHHIEINGLHLAMTCVSMGNPHAVFFVEDVTSVDLEDLGPRIENHSFFPKKTNVHFVQVLSPRDLQVRTWERGSGITLACGTGACACAVAGALTGRTGRTCVTHLPGGDLDLTWHPADQCVYMAGPAIEVFDGTWLG